jgi:hypothetical protein
MKSFYFFALMLMMAGNAFAQELKYSQLSDKVAYNGEGKYAIVIIRASSALELEFSTNLDGNRSVIKKTEKNEVGNQTEYTLTFDAEQVPEAKLFVKNKNYNQLVIPIKLSPNGAITFIVEDPENFDSEPCHIKHKKYGDKFFIAANYEGAKDEYLSSLDCWPENDSNSANIQRKIADIDSVLRILKEVATTYNLRKKYDLYNEAYRLNPADKSFEEKKDEAYKAYYVFCASCLQQANEAYRSMSGDKGEAMYREIVKKDCPDKKLAEERIKGIEEKKYHPYHVLTYEYAENVPLGISTGNYKSKKVGAYFTLRLNSQVFALIRNDEETARRPELNTSVGLSFPIAVTDRLVNFWIFAGLGYTGVTQYLKRSYTSGDYKLYLHSAISPEAGVLTKIAIGDVDRIVLRYTFQYRYALVKEYDDFIGNIRHVLGIGVSF